MSNVDNLIEQAKKVRANAYAPYSNFHVGACIKTKNNQIFSGCNIENISYRLTLCAEASAIAQMVSAGERGIAEIAIISSGTEPCFPCGACRQSLLEFSDTNTLVHICDNTGAHQTYKLVDLVPFAFGPENLASAK